MEARTEDMFVDCKSAVGETVGLIDAAIITLRLASRGEVNAPEVVEALADLATDAEIAQMLRLVNAS